MAHTMAWLNNKPTENWFGLLLSYNAFATSDRWVAQEKSLRAAQTSACLFR